MSHQSSPPFFWTPPSWVVMGFMLCAVFFFHLALPMVAGLIMFVLVDEFYQKFKKKVSSNSALTLSIVLAVCIIMGGVGGALWAISSIIDSNQSAQDVMIKSTEALGLIKEQLPSTLSNIIPPSSYSLLLQFKDWVADNLSAVAGLGKKVFLFFFHIIIGSFIGALIAIRKVKTLSLLNTSLPWFLQELLGHIKRFALCFKRVFFAQAYISISNTIFTGIFIGVIMPILGMPLPFVGILIFITFLMGFLPLIGNIVSNIVIALAALSVSPAASFIVLGFLVIIHKLEYFLNAWIVGTKIKVCSYELLVAMLASEALFGVWGLVLAPVLYAYIKEEFFIQSSLVSTPPPH